MSLKEKIQAEKIAAVKSGNKELATLLGTIIGELDRISKNPTDNDVLTLIKKMCENAKECGNFNEIKILESYLPSMMSDEDLTKIIVDYCKEQNLVEKKSMGMVMKFLKENYNNLYDGKNASVIIGKILK